MKRTVLISILLLSAVGLGAQGRGGRGQGGGDGQLQGIAPGQPPGAGRWTRLAPIPEPNEERNGVVSGGKLYLIGGNPVGMTGAPPGAVWEYDPAGDKWTKKKNMPLAAHHVAVAENAGKIYVFGGGTQKQAGGPSYVPANNAWEYDPAADSWKAACRAADRSPGGGCRGSWRQDLRVGRRGQLQVSRRAIARPEPAASGVRRQRGLRPRDQFMGQQAGPADAAQRDVSPAWSTERSI
jgi:N-acetylneuraminic acid mutarotase